MKRLFGACLLVAWSVCGGEYRAELGETLRVRVGDRILLPACVEGEEYVVLHGGVGVLDGDVVEVVGEGILGVEKLEGGVSRGVIGVLSMPERIGDGRIFLWKSEHWASGEWGNPEAWELLEGVGEGDYPHRANDIAICAVDGGWRREIALPHEVVLGGLMVGSYRLERDMYYYPFVLHGAEGSGSVLTFARTDRKAAWLRYYPNGTSVEEQYYASHPMFGMSGHPLTMRCESDVEMDLGWVAGENSKQNLVRPEWTEYSTLEIPEGRVLTLRNGSPWQEGALSWIVYGAGRLVGAGKIVNASGSSFRFDFEGADFSGTIVEASRGREGYDRNANTWFSKSDTLEDAALEIHGFVTRQDHRTYEAKYGAGYSLIGLDHGWPGQGPIGNRLAGREVVLYGGRLDLKPEKTEWGDSSLKLRYETERLVVSNGFSYVLAHGPDSNSTFPEMRFAAQRVAHGNKASVMLEHNGLWTTQNSDRGEVYFPWFEEEAVGGIVPWMVGFMDHPGWGGDGGWESVRFPMSDGAGHLRASNTVECDVASAPDDANVWCNQKDLRLESDKTINSLVLRNRWGGTRVIGEGRTLTIRSGGLVLNNCTLIGENSWGQAQPASSCGSLAFGATAYVYVNNHQADNPSWIMVPMVAPYGWVYAYPGYMLLAGDQSGIDDELVVQAGQLTLGIVRNHNGADLRLPCTLDVPVRIVGGGARLVIAQVGQPTLEPTQNVYFDDVGGFAGTLEIPAGVTETCQMMYVRNSLEGEAWGSVERGTYGASGSGAEFIDDVHFAGGGVLVVRKDELVRPTLVLMR